jgi:hypothetical protein
MVMQTVDVWDLDDRAGGWRLDSPRDGSILVQREVSAPLMIVGEVVLQVAAQRALVPHDDVIEALASEGADQALNERILPGTAISRGGCSGRCSSGSGRCPCQPADGRALPEIVGEERTEGTRSVRKNVGGVVPRSTIRFAGRVFRCDIHTGSNPDPNALWLV